MFMYINRIKEKGRKIRQQQQQQKAKKNDNNIQFYNSIW